VRRPDPVRVVFLKRAVIFGMIIFGIDNQIAPPGILIHQPVDNADNLISLRYGQSPTRAKVVLKINHN
jgi:hypothetical protein